MKPVWLSSHIFLDGYGSDADAMENTSVMSVLLRRINEALFGNRGCIKIAPVFNDEKPRNNGISGMILARDEHFTCHTFSQRGVFFADVCTASDRRESFIPLLLEESFHPDYTQLCERDLGPGFGRQVVMRLPSLLKNVANRLLDEILDAIQMTRLCRRMSYCDGADLLQPITESHVALHCNEHSATLDVFSCKDFSVEKLLSVLDRFNVQPIMMVTVSRGVDMTDKIL